MMCGSLDKSSLLGYADNGIFALLVVLVAVMLPSCICEISASVAPAVGCSHLKWVPHKGVSASHGISLIIYQ